MHSARAGTPRGLDIPGRRPERDCPVVGAFRKQGLSTTMTIADKPHGRTRYNAGCCFGVCRSANREHSRRQRSKNLRHIPRLAESPPTEFIDGPVTEAVRAQLASLNNFTRTSGSVSPTVPFLIGLLTTAISFCIRRAQKPAEVINRYSDSDTTVAVSSIALGLPRPLNLWRPRQCQVKVVR